MSETDRGDHRGGERSDRPSAAWPRASPPHRDRAHSPRQDRRSSDRPRRSRSRSSERRHRQTSASSSRHQQHRHDDRRSSPTHRYRSHRSHSRSPPRGPPPGSTSHHHGNPSRQARDYSHRNDGWRSNGSNHFYPSRPVPDAAPPGPSPAGDVVLTPPLHIRRQQIDERARHTGASAASNGGDAAAATVAAAGVSCSAGASTVATAVAGAPRVAFATLVMLGDAYAPGALVLAHSLRAAGTRASLVCLVTADVSPSARLDLALEFDEVIEVPLLSGQAIHREWKRYMKPAAGQGKPMYQWIGHSFTKFGVLSLVQFDLVCLLDADMLCVAPPDEIFELRAPAGLCSTIEGIAHNNSMHGRRLSTSEVATACARSYGMRGCLYLLRPNPDHLALVRDVLRDHGGYGERRFHVGADEKMMSDLYLDEWSHAHWRFGCNSWKSGEAIIGRPPVFLHFVTEKPWQPKEVWPDTRQWGEYAQAVMNSHPQVRPRFQDHLDALHRDARQQGAKQGGGGTPHT